MAVRDLRRTVWRRRVVTFDDHPARRGEDVLAAGRRGRHVPDEMKRAFVKNRAVEPEDVLDVVLDFGVVTLMQGERVRAEVAMSDGSAIVSRACPVQMRSGNPRRKDEKWNGHKQSCGARQEANHALHY